MDPVVSWEKCLVRLLVAEFLEENEGRKNR